MAEGRRLMRLSGELEPAVFAALLGEFQSLVREVLEGNGGHHVEVDGDTVTAVFPSAKQAALAAVAAQRGVATHEWPDERKPVMSVGLDTTADGCADLCDAAEGRQIFLGEAVSKLLESADLGRLSVQDLSDVRLRRSDRTMRACELLYPAADT